MARSPVGRPDDANEARLGAWNRAAAVQIAQPKGWL
jgi:hypothetical protein